MTEVHQHSNNKFDLFDIDNTTPRYSSLAHERVHHMTTSNMTSNGHILQWDILPLLCYGETVKLRESFTCIALMDDNHRCTHQIGPDCKSQARDLAYGSFPRRGLNDLRPHMITDEQLDELIGVLLCKTSGHRKNDGVRQKTLKRCRDILEVKIEGQDTKKQLSCNQWTPHKVDQLLMLSP